MIAAQRGEADVPARERLFASAAELFAEKGYGSVSVRAICLHAGTSNNMVHHYFGSKAGLLDAIVNEYGVSVFELPLRLLAQPVRSRNDFISRIALLFETTLEALIAQRSTLMVVMREQAEPGAMASYSERFTEFLEAAKVAGVVRTELDTEMVTGFYLDRLINQVQYAPWLTRTFGIDVAADADYRRRWCSANTDLLLNGLLA